MLDPCKYPRHDPVIIPLTTSSKSKPPFLFLTLSAHCNFPEQYNSLFATDLARHRKRVREHPGDLVGASLLVADRPRAASDAGGYRHWNGDRTVAALPVSVALMATGCPHRVRAWWTVRYDHAGVVVGCWSVSDVTLWLADQSSSRYRWVWLSRQQCSCEFCWNPPVPC